MRELILNPYMGDAVLARLQDFTPLPAKGYVAGQAVASAVSELFGDGSAVAYNDVDVFRAQTPEELQSFEESWDGVRSNRAIRTTQFTTLEIEEEYRQPVLNTVDRYRVLQTKRRGLLNEIVCEFSDSSPRKFLDTFDMNCVQVAVDLETRKLIWTPEFERFTRTRELDVVTLHTPFHSLIRYFKKKAELDGVFGNDKRIIEMLAAAYYIEMNNGHRGESGLREYSNLRWRFGQGYRDKLTPVAGLILPHFSIVSEMVKGYEVTHLKPRFDVDTDFCISRDMPDIVHCLPKYSRALREKHSKGTHRQVSYLTTHSTEPGLIRDHWLVHGDEFLTGDFTTDQLEKMEDISTKHSFAMRLSSPTLPEMLAKFQMVQEEVAQRGRWVYQVLAPGCDLDGCRDTFAQFLDEQATLMRKALKRPSLPVLKAKGYLARELVTTMDVAVHMPRYGREPDSWHGEYIRGNKARFVVLTRPGRPGSANLVELRRTFGRLDWQVNSLSAKKGKDWGPEESKVVSTYLNFTNLAVVLGKYPTAALVRVAPETASALGAFIGSKVLAKLPRSFKPQFGFSVGPRLATKLGMDWPVRAETGYWYSPSEFGFWKEHAKRKWMKLVAPKEYAKFAPQYAEDAEEIPF